jgi:integrase
MLILTGQCRSEVADARWSEFDLHARLWTIPPERMKMTDPHVVPITDHLYALLQSLPRIAAGDHLFSNSFGERSVPGFGNAKGRIRPDHRPDALHGSAQNHAHQSLSPLRRRRRCRQGTKMSA